MNPESWIILTVMVSQKPVTGLVQPQYNMVLFIICSFLYDLLCFWYFGSFGAADRSGDGKRRRCQQYLIAAWQKLLSPDTEVKQIRANVEKKENPNNQTTAICSGFILSQRPFIF